MARVSFDAFWHWRSPKRDAVSLRISVLGIAAHKIDKATEAALPPIPFKNIRGMRNRIAHDYGAVDFKIVLGRGPAGDRATHRGYGGAFEIAFRILSPCRRATTRLAMLERAGIPASP